MGVKAHYKYVEPDNGTWLDLQAYNAVVKRYKWLRQNKLGVTAHTFVQGWRKNIEPLFAIVKKFYRAELSKMKTANPYKDPIFRQHRQKKPKIKKAGLFIRTPVDRDAVRDQLAGLAATLRPPRPRTVAETAREQQRERDRQAIDRYVQMQANELVYGRRQ